MDAQKELDRIAHTISRCRQCRHGKSGLPVPGEGDAHAELMFIGEAPGRREAETGRPFVGRSVMLLTRYLLAIGIDRKDVYISSPVKYFPGPRAPTPTEIAHGRKHLQKQIKVINPQLIVLLGNTAMKSLLRGLYQVTKFHGQVVEEVGKRYFLTFHPAAALRFPKTIAPLLKNDFKKLKTLVSQ